MEQAIDWLQFILSKGWVGSLIGLAGLIAAGILYLRSREKNTLAFQYSTLQLLGGDESALPDEVTISYKDREVPRVSSTKLYLWNAGTETIRGEDLVAADPLRITFPEGTVLLRMQKMAETRDVIGFHVREDEGPTHEAPCHFDFLDPGDGVTLEILNTSGSAEPKLEGTIRGIPDGPQNWGVAAEKQPSPLPGNFSKRGVYWLGVVAGILFVLYGLLRPEIAEWFPSLIDPSSDAGNSIAWQYLAVGGLYMIPPASILWMRRRRFPSDLADWGNSEKEREGAKLEGLSLQEALYRLDELADEGEDN